MSDDHVSAHAVEKPHESAKIGDKPPADSAITKKTDSQTTERMKLQDAMKSFKLTADGQASFKIDMGNGHEVKDQRALRAGEAAQHDHTQHDHTQHDHANDNHANHKPMHDALGLPGAIDASAPAKSSKERLIHPVDSTKHPPEKPKIVSPSNDRDHHVVKNPDGSSTESVVLTNGDREETRRDKTGREVEHDSFSKSPSGTEELVEKRTTNYDASGWPEATTVRFNGGKESERIQEDAFGNGNVERYRYSDNGEKIVAEQVVYAKGTIVDTRFNDANQITSRDTAQVDGRPPVRETFDHTMQPPGDTKAPQIQDDGERTVKGSESDKNQPASDGPSQHPWEDKRKQQLTDGYKLTDPTKAGTLPDYQLKETKGQIDSEVSKREAQHRDDLEAKYVKQGETPEQAKEAAKLEMKESHDKTVARISEQVDHFECIRRDQLQTYYLQHGESQENASTHAEKDIKKAHDGLVTDTARFETTRRDELEMNKLTGTESPQQIEAIKKDVDKQIDQTYQHVYELMQKTCTWTPGLDILQRQQLASEVMHQVSDTTDIKQGRHETCNAATIEATTSSRYPEEAARLVEEVALTGIYKVGNIPYRMPHENLTYHTKAEQKPTGQRSFASQIFQTTAVNLYLLKHEPGKRYYESDNLDKHKPDDTGERKQDGDKPAKAGPPGNFAAPGNFIEIQNLITGEKGTVLSNNERTSDADRVTYVSSVQKLEQQLSEAKKNHKFPITIEVNVAKEPFHSEGGRSGSHVVTIRGYDDSDPKNPKVFVDNQWSSKMDHLQGMDLDHSDKDAPCYNSLSTQTLFGTMQFPGTHQAPKPKDKTSSDHHHHK
jgi:hypothetical protein